ncbi:hypothetical protein N9N28_06015 [Rubripirellula amarantea]|nr:hypothetical protein [Rubripirellula amarantea]
MFRRYQSLSFVLFMFLVATGLSTSTWGQDARPQTTPATESRVPPAKPLFRDFMGINGHTVNFKPELYRPVARLVRDYHPIDWDLGDDTAYPVEFPFARNGVNWESVYGSWKEHGIEIDACLMFSSIAPDRWKNLQADAERYGSEFAKNFGPSSKRNLVSTVEIGNEPGNYDHDTYIEVFRSMAKGVRKADPKMKIATCNVYADEGGDYHKPADRFLGLDELYDVLSIHSYAMISSWPKWERSYPEDQRFPGFIRDIDRLIEWRNNKAPDKEVWLTEFGYDSSTKKPTKDDEFAQWEGSSDTQQAQWLVRSYFLFATRDLQRAYIYFFNDEDVPKLHNASGLTRHYQPKPSYFAVSHLLQTLGDYRFSRVVQRQVDQSCVYEFAHETDPNQAIWVAWSPTGVDRKSEVEVDLDGWQIERGEQMPMVDETPDTVTVTREGEKVVLPISESPSYFWLKR